MTLTSDTTPDPLKRLLLKAFLFYSFAVFLSAMVVLYPLMVLPVKWFGERGRKLSYFAFRVWGSSFWLSFIRFSRRGVENVPATGPILLVANHNSFLDSPAMYIATPRPFKPLGKVEMAKYPVFGALYRVACLLVDRTKAASRTASLAAMAREWRAGGAVLVFPEGKMNVGDEPLQPFHEASFQVAMRMGATLVPMVIEGSRRSLPAYGPFLIRPGHIRVTYLPPLYPGDYQGYDAAAISERVRGMMQDVLMRQEECVATV